MNEIAAYIDSLILFDQQVQLLNTDLYTMVQDIEAFDEQITALNDSIGQLNETIAAISVPEGVAMTAQANSAVHYNTVNMTNEGDVNNNKSTAERAEGKEVANESDGVLSKVKQVSKIAKSVTDTAEVGLDILGKFGKTFPKIEKGVKIASKIFSVGEDIAELGEAATGIVEGGSAFAAGASIAETVALIPGIGIALAAGALATGVVMEVVNSDKKEKAEKREIRANALSSFEMTDDYAHKYVNEVPPPKEKPKAEHLWHIGPSPYKNKLVQATEKNELLGGVIIPKTDNLKNNLSAQYQPQLLQTKEERTIDIAHKYLTWIATRAHNGGKINMDSETDLLYQQAERLGGMVGIDSTTTLGKAVQWARYDLVKEQNAGKTNEEIKASQLKKVQQASGQQKGGNTIILNMNRAMIENFTVNTTNVKESTAEIKHIVETTLLDTLQHVHANG